MQDTQVWLSRDDLLAYLAEAGYEVTVAQLNRWSRHGLIPRPKMEGRGRARGFKSSYPAIAYLNAIVLAEFLPEVHSLDRLGWRMWCLGFPVTDGARSIMLQKFRSVRKRFRDDQSAFEKEQLNNLIERSATATRLPRPWRQMRKRIRNQKMPTVVRMMHEIMLGEFNEQAYEDDDYEIMRGAFGITGSSTEELRNFYSNLSRTLGVSELERIVENATNDDLELWRDEIQTLRGLLDPHPTRPNIMDLLQWSIARRETPLGVLLLKLLENLGHPERQGPPLLRSIREHPDYTPAVGI